MIPTYSEAAKAAIPLLSKSVYKAFVFFEDENSENFYEEIIEKITADHKNVRVICLNGKESLISHCINPENHSTKSKTIYVLDKDFDDLTENQISDEAIFYLHNYSIENHLLEAEAIDRIVLEEKPKISKLIKRGAVAIDHLKNQKELFFELSSLFLINEVYSLGIKSCSEPIQRFSIENTPWNLCETKIGNYREEISAALILNGHAPSEFDLLEILDENKNKILDFCHTPGKQLLDITRFFLNNTYNTRIPSRDSFAFRLASLCKFESLEELRMKLQKLLTTSRKTIGHQGQTLLI